MRGTRLIAPRCISGDHGQRNLVAPSLDRCGMPSQSFFILSHCQRRSPSCSTLVDALLEWPTSAPGVLFD